MENDRSMELYRQLRSSQDKYVYFLLAAVGASIAFAMTQTKDSPLSESHIFLGISILSWGASFFFGCRHLEHVNSTLYANLEMLKIEDGSHPKVGAHPQMIAAASEGIRSAIDKNANSANTHAKLQFYTFVIGVIAYVSWHILEMWLRLHH